MVEDKRVGIREWLMIVTLALNVAGMVWSVATWSNQVIELRRAVELLSLTLSVTTREFGEVRLEYNARLAVLETLIAERTRR